MTEHPLATMTKLDSNFVEHLKQNDEWIFSEGALPRKYKYLMAMAFDAAHGAANGVRALAQSAVRQGATKEEIVETLRVACHLAGVGSVYTASQGLKDLFE